MALSVVEGLLIALALIVLVPIAVLFGEVFLAVTASGADSPHPGRRPRLAVIVPAHNEAPLIAATLHSLTPQLLPGDRLIVVADNCSDETAAVAAAQGAEVITRNDSSRRGKSYALDHGIRFLQSDAPEVVIVVDADCNVSSGAIERLSRDCLATHRPTQALYLLSAPTEASPIGLRIAQFALTVKNLVRPMGLHRLGLPCQLMGSGMAFPWPLITHSRLATGHITEDLKLGIDLARAGSPPLFCPGARVTSSFPASSEGVRTQRTRWEHGHLSVILSDAPGLFLHSLARLDVRAMVLALDLGVPPLALLSMGSAGLWLASMLLYVVTARPTALALTTVGVVLLALSVLLAWRCYGRGILSLRSLLLGVVYSVGKLPLYARFLRARQLEWVRSKRDSETL